MKTTSNSPDVDSVRETHPLEVARGLARVLFAAVRVEDDSPGTDRAREEGRGVADGAAELADAPRPDRAREKREQGGDRRTHDRDVAFARGRLDLGEDRIARRKDVDQVTIELGGDERRHGAIIAFSYQLSAISPTLL